MLGTLSQYLNGHENLKRVMNSPCLDHHGKFLSRDGTKIFTANNNYNKGNGGRFNKRNGGRNGGNGNNRKNRGNNNQKKSKGSNNHVKTRPFIYFQFRVAVNPAKGIPIMGNTGAVSTNFVVVTTPMIVSLTNNPRNSKVKPS